MAEGKIDVEAWMKSKASRDIERVLTNDHELYVTKDKINSIRKKKISLGIQDFGEKIGGAKKDRWFEKLEFYAENFSKEMVEKYTIMQFFPKPKYQNLEKNGISTENVALIHAIRDRMADIKAKHRDPSELQDFPALFALVQDIMRTNPNSAELAAFVEKTGIQDAKQLYLKAKLYAKIGHEENLRDYEVDEHANRYAVNVRDKQYMKRESEDFDEIADIVREYLDKKKEKKAEKETNQQKRGKYLYVIEKDDQYYISIRKRGSLVPISESFATEEEANAYGRKHYQELQELLANPGTIPNERREKNRARIGQVVRYGNVDPEQFSETFGFRGVEFGNWVGEKTRREDLNKTYDALMDLADVLNCSPRSLSLNGTLALAFGARGGGKTCAHYEPLKQVINLTKTKGAGCLAHEWFHAFDNYLGGTLTYISELKKSDTEIPYDLEHAWNTLTEVLESTGLYARSEQLDAQRFTPYWGKTHELFARAFEAYVVHTLEMDGHSNDFLVNIKNEREWYAETSEKSTLPYPYPTRDEIQEVERAFTSLFQKSVLLTTSDGISFVKDEKMVSKEYLQGVLDRCRDKVDSIKNTCIYDTIEDMLENLADKMENGFVLDKEDGTMYVCRENVTNIRNFASSLLCELLEVAPIKNFYNEDVWESFCNTVYTTLDVANNPVKEDIVLQVLEQYLTSDNAEYRKQAREFSEKIWNSCVNYLLDSLDFEQNEPVPAEYLNTLFSQSTNCVQELRTNTTPGM